MRRAPPPTAVVCVHLAQLDPSFLGRLIDEDFLSQRPARAGPIFSNPVKFVFGEGVCRDSFGFAIYC
jgi:hypothetical protein